MAIGDMFKSAWSWVRKMPFARWFRPLWQGALRELVKAECEALKAKLLAVLAQQGPKAIDDYIDAWQMGLKRRIEALPLPQGIELPVLEAIEKHGNALQEQLQAGIAQGGPVAVNAAFETAQRVLLAKIEQL